MHLGGLGSRRQSGLVNCNDAELIFTSFFKINHFGLKFVAGAFTCLLPVWLKPTINYGTINNI
jgi:hypothetical protein